jgi:hypothetical protein
VHKRTDARIDRNYDDLTVAKGNIMLIAIVVVVLRVIQGRNPLGG